MKISIITPIYPYPNRGDYLGLERHVENLALSLKRYGHDIQIITTFWNGGNRTDNHQGIRILRLRELKWFIGRLGSLYFLHYITFGLNLYRKKCFKFCKDSDMILLNIPLPFTRFFKRKGIPLVSIFHHYVPIESLDGYLYFPMYHILERRQFKQHKNVIAISDQTKKELIKYYKLNESDIKVISTGINLQKFNPSNRSEKVIKDHGNNILLYCGLMTPRKRVPVLLQAMVKVKKEIPDVKLLLTGKGLFLEKYKQLAISLDLQENVSFLGFVTEEELMMYYASCNIFVFPSELEGFGQVLIEAMASGTPVICADKPPMSDVIKNGGITFKVNNYQDLANKIIHLLQNDQELEELRIKALNVAKTYEWNNTFKIYENYLLKIIKEK